MLPILDSSLPCAGTADLAANKLKITDRFLHGLMLVLFLVVGLSVGQERRGKEQALEGQARCLLRRPRATPWVQGHGN